MLSTFWSLRPSALSQQLLGTHVEQGADISAQLKSLPNKVAFAHVSAHQGWCLFVILTSCQSLEHPIHTHHMSVASVLPAGMW